MRLLIPISSTKPNAFFDPTCVIEVGEHPFITKQSFVAYRHIQERSASKIEKCLEQGEFVLKPDCSKQLLQRILEGIDRSNFTAPWVLKQFR